MRLVNLRITESYFDILKILKLRLTNVSCWVPYNKKTNYYLVNFKNHQVVNKEAKFCNIPLGILRILYLHTDQKMLEWTTHICHISIPLFLRSISHNKYVFLRVKRYSLSLHRACFL